MMTIDRRQFSRILFDAEASLKNDEGESRVHVLDISLKGVLIRPQDQIYLQIGSRAALKLRLGEHEATIAMQVTVAHHQGPNYGLSCREIDIDSMTHLRRLVELNLGDESLLNRELSALSV